MTLKRRQLGPWSAATACAALAPDHQLPEPAWKAFDDFKDYIHPRQKTPNGEP